MFNKSKIPARSLFFSFFFTAVFSFISSVALCATINVAQDATGDYTTIQAALDAAVAGDTVIVSGGIYNEDINIGHFGTKTHPEPVKKDNVTLMAAEGETVDVILAHNSNRLVSWAANFGIDLGDSDSAGVVINGENAVMDGFRIINNSLVPNILGLSFTVYIGAPNVTVQNCTIIGPTGATPDPTITDPHPVYIGILTFSSCVDINAVMGKSYDRPNVWNTPLSILSSLCTPSQSIKNS